MGVNLYIADKGRFVESKFTLECNVYTGPALLEAIGIKPETDQGTVGTIKNADLPKAIIDQARVMGKMHPAADSYYLEYSQRFLNLLVYAHDTGHDVGWS